MISFIPRLMVGFLVVFGVCVVAAAAYEWFWVMPEKRCIAAHHWWDSHERVCGTPVFLPALTGRPNKVVGHP